MAKSEISILVNAMGAAIRGLSREQAATISNQLVDMLDWRSPREHLLIAMDAVGISASGKYHTEQARLVADRAARRTTQSERRPVFEMTTDAAAIQSPTRHVGYETVKNNDHSPKNDHATKQEAKL